MLVVLSPAKKLNENHPVLENATIPQFVTEAEKLINNLKKYTPKKLSKLMSLSNALSELNVDRYQNWNVKHDEETAKTAVLIFDGEVYSGLEADKFTKKQLEYTQNHLRVLSGLYGILKPLDLVHPYRLEMGTKLKTGRKNNLYEFWGDKIVNEINTLLANQQQSILVNLASTEYFKVVNTKKLKGTVITPVFKDFNNGKYKVVMVYAKKARGMMANYIIKNKIEKVEELEGFNSDGYCFNQAASTNNELVFLRG
jgi:uncharacterized protein